jgi:hypothetical protein
VVKQAVVSNEDMHATACSVHRRFEPIHITATTGASAFLPKLKPLFLLAKEVLRTNRATNSESAGNLQLA